MWGEAVNHGNNKSLSARDLRNCRQFYLVFNDFPNWYARVPNLISILRDNQQLFAAKYLTYLPPKEALLLEIERQKSIN